MDDNSTQMNELLVNYLDGDLTGASKEEFEKKLSADAGLREELEDLKAAREAIKMYGLNSQVRSVHQEMMAEMKPQGIVRNIGSTRRIIRYSLTAAASVVVIGMIILGYYFFSLSSNKLYNEKYNSFELSSLRGSNENQFTEIEKAFRQKNYSAVITIPQAGETNIKDQFLTGISYLELNKLPGAINVLKKVVALDQHSDHPIYKDEAEYYLALAYLKNKNYDNAIDLMWAIHNNTAHLYNNKFPKSFIHKVQLMRWR